MTKEMTLLDMLEEGNAAFLEQESKKSRRERKRLPDGCGEGQIYRDIARLAWPSFVELLLTSLVSMVDMIMVGTMVNGDEAISAVSLASQPKFIFVSLLIALNVGVTVVIARARGAGNKELANNALGFGILLSFTVSVVSSITGFVFAEPLIRFMATESLSGETIGLSCAYFQIQMAGFATMGITTTFTASLRGVGYSKIPMQYNITANLINIVGNYLLINGHLGFPALGVAGASLATVIGQLVAFCLAFAKVMSKKCFFTLSLPSFVKTFRQNWYLVGGITRVGIPSLVEQFITRVGMILFARQIASLGQPYFTTHQILSNIQTLTFMVGQAMAVSSTALVGQSLGKRRPDMAEHYSRRCTRVGVLLGVALCVFLLCFGKNIVGLYSQTEAVLIAAGPALILMALGQPMQTPTFILTGSLRGAGDTKSTAVITLIGILCIRPILGALFLRYTQWKLTGAWIAITIDVIIRMLLVIGIYNRGRWKKVHVL